MLQLKNITKVYAAGTNSVKALNGVSLTFRHSEFVSILGQSGCGKTTLLNLVGGLDRYTSGDLIINGKSTRTFGSRDWDSYRNHTIGFVFQNYNLIPHQTVLQNVELALSLSGVPKKERRRRAKEALEQVGLGDQLRKKPGEMSGGQMQRVAIARALVNNPDIILADEPTGALDTETSVQVMEILKEVSKDRLVVMVTHNPELAEQYSTRIIRMLDGKITGDSAPLTPEELAEEERLEQAKNPETKTKKRQKKPSMSFATSFALSLKNLITKKGRTILTSFAGSIGIIGIALIFAVSRGMTTFIDTVQEETLSSYPLTLEAMHVDASSLLTTFIGQAQSAGDHEKDAVYQKTMLYDLVNSLNNMETSENDLKSFKAYLEQQMANTSPDNPLRDAVSGIQYSYDLELLIYTKNVDGTILRSDTEELLMDLMLKYLDLDMSSMVEMSESYGFGDMMTMGMGGAMNLWQEIVPGNNGELINPLLHNQYELIDGGRWPAAYNEVVLVVDENNEIDDMTLYALGLKSKADMDALADAAIQKHEIEVSQESWSYEEIRNMEFRAVFPFDCYSYDEATGLYKDMRVEEDGDESLFGMQYLYDNGLPLKVTGIIRPKEDAVGGMLTSGIAYTSALTEYVIEQAENAPVVKAQLASPDTDVITGLPFELTTDKMSAEEFTAFLATLDDATKARIWVAYMADISDDELKNRVDPIMANTPLEQMKATLEATAAQLGSAEDAKAYLASLDDKSVTAAYRGIIEQQVAGEYAAGKLAEYAAKDTAAVVSELNAALNTLTDDQRMTLYKAAEFITFVNEQDQKGMADTYVEILVAQQQAQTISQIEMMSRENIMGFIDQLAQSGQIEFSSEMKDFLEAKSDEELKELCVSVIESNLEKTKAETKAQIQANLAASGMGDPAAQAAALTQMMGSFTAAQLVNYHDNVLAFSESTYEDNLVLLGNLDLESPSAINIYASSFENKDIIEDAITKYNEGKDELSRIVYTDYVGLMMSSITTIINAITYVLIAFVAISLIVSSIMIGVITLISVQERTKEIGILRAIGASKRNVSSMFNAETVIIGFTSGLLGVGITYLLCIPINLILHALTGIGNLRTVLPIEIAAILVVISVLLTLISGIIPSRSAAKKDPVVALRSE